MSHDAWPSKTLTSAPCADIPGVRDELAAMKMQTRKKTLPEAEQPNVPQQHVSEKQISHSNAQNSLYYLYTHDKAGKWGWEVWGRR